MSFFLNDTDSIKKLEKLPEKLDWNNMKRLDKFICKLHMSSARAYMHFKGEFYLHQNIKTAVEHLNNMKQYSPYIMMPLWSRPI